MAGPRLHPPPDVDRHPADVAGHYAPRRRGRRAVDPTALSRLLHRLKEREVRAPAWTVQVSLAHQQRQQQHSKVHSLWQP